MRKNYETPETEIIVFAAEDVMDVSNVAEGWQDDFFADMLLREDLLK